ncbi:carboxy methyl transferase for protein phosphatase 2A [Scheffersomyces spartinae]|uniref:Leucine carboxyl methyltransferase 1 n=1 Tax=Scheffersomyces spartinae TaxID=45513 RepID=A0A9P8AHR1_9ASCO|nr:carboxy methyl transferase for protein phosphatase 2A [Scheffersomyces spartinae]KAG7192777.1 carboxy methyl transferase for protein phosphatase 2A [Scheffersomyces spartinae]
MSSQRILREAFQNKLPLINRGTYLRTMSLDWVMEEFTKNAADERVQIISLGSGMDTRSFTMLKKYKNMTYHEIDFPESTRIKKLAITNNQQLSQIVNTKHVTVEINSAQGFQRVNCDLHTSNYHLYGRDLRQVEEYSTLLKDFDHKVPTLVLSECCLCYLPMEDNERLITKFREMSPDLLGFLIYEPMALGDNFGKTMKSNLQKGKGIKLPTFESLPDLDVRLSFLRDTCGFENIRLTDLSYVGGYSKPTNKGGWIEFKELYRISRLEWIDEVEEITLLLKHYCLCYGEYTNGVMKFEESDPKEYRWIKS